MGPMRWCSNQRAMARRIPRGRRWDTVRPHPVAWPIAAMLCGVSGAAFADTAELHVYLDTDRVATTGCTSTTAEGLLRGSDARITATIDTTTRQVTALTQASCEGGTFSRQGDLEGAAAVPYPLIAGEGDFGSDVIEVRVSRSVFALADNVPVAIDLTSSLGRDALLTADGTRDGPPLELKLDVTATRLARVSGRSAARARVAGPSLGRPVFTRFLGWALLGIPLLFVGRRRWRHLSFYAVLVMASCSSSDVSEDLFVRDAPGDGSAGLDIVSLRTTVDGDAIVLQLNAVVLDALPDGGLPQVIANPDVTAAQGLPLVYYGPSDRPFVEDAASGMAFRPEEIIVVLESSATVADLNALLAREGARLVVAGPTGIANAYVRFRYPSPLSDLFGKSESLEEQPAVEAAAPVARARPQITTPDIDAPRGAPPSPQCIQTLPNGGDWQWANNDAGTWGHKFARIPQMWNFFPQPLGPPTVVTAVFDTEFHPHNDVPISFPFTAGPIRLPAGSAHGTSMASIIGAERNTADNDLGIDGINPRTVLLGVDNAEENAPDVWALVLGRRRDIDIVNMSFSTADVPGLDLEDDDLDAIRRQILAVLGTVEPLLRAHPGVLFVSAAGNHEGRIPASLASPQNYAALERNLGNVAVVGGVDPNDIFSTISNSGGHILAPGESVLTAGFGNGYVVDCGTSISTAIVSAIAGNLKALDPGLAPGQIISILRATAFEVGESETRSVDAFASVLELDRERNNYRHLLTLLDIDDGSQDGHERVQVPAAEPRRNRSFALVVGPADVDVPDDVIPSPGDEVILRPGERSVGDGRIDMADFRAFRDWLYLAEGRQNHRLNGRPTHLQNDANLDGYVDLSESGTAEAHTFPRADFNGDGILSPSITATMNGQLGADLTDLEVFIRGVQDATAWQDPLYEDPEHLRDLLNSVDIHISARNYFAKYSDVSSLSVAPLTEGTGRPIARWEDRRVTLTRDAPEQLITVAAGQEIYIASEPIEIEDDRRIVVRSIDSRFLSVRDRGADFAVDLVRTELGADAEIQNPPLEDRQPTPQPGDDFVDAFIGEPGEGEFEETISNGARGWANNSGTLYTVARTGGLPAGSRPMVDETQPTVFESEVRWQRSFIRTSGPDPSFEVKPLRLYVKDGSGFFEYEAHARIEVQWRPAASSEWNTAYASRATIAGSRFVPGVDHTFRVVNERHMTDERELPNGMVDLEDDPIVGIRGLRYNKAGYNGEVDLGDMEVGDTFEVRYILTSSVAADPTDAFAYAYIGDPFEFGSGVKFGYGRFGQAAYVLDIDIPGNGQVTVTFVPRDGSYTILYRNEVAVAIVGPGVDEITDPDAPPGVESGDYRLDHQPTDQPLDTDLDGIDDVYELQYNFLDPLDATDARDDFDGDGRSNLLEYTEGTDPSVPDAVVARRTAFSDRIVGEGRLLGNAVELNGDGQLDLLVMPSGFSPLLQSSINVGGGLFDTPQSTTVPNIGSILSSATADVDGNNRIDIVVADAENDRVQVMLGDGQGGFTAGGQFATGDFPHRVYAADVNDDGRPDILTSNQTDNTVSVLLNRGNAAFAAPTTVTLNGRFNPLDVRTGDLNGDLAIDLVVADLAGVSIYNGNGDGTFGTGRAYTVPTDVRALTVVDVSGDGVPDVMTANGTSSQVAVLIGQGDGTLAAATTYTTARGAAGFCAEDIDGDGDRDLVVGHFDASLHAVLLNNGTGAFSPQTPAYTSNSAGCVLIDVTDDGQPDLLSGSTGGYFISENLGGGRFDTRTDVRPANTFLTDFTVVDINGDTHRDVLIPNEAGGSVEILRGDGTGALVYDQTLAVGAKTAALVAAPLDGDSLVDIAVLTRTDPILPASANTLTLLLADRAGGFTARAPIALPDWALGLHAGDINGDLQPDLLVRMAGSTVVYLNQAGMFTASAPLSLSARGAFLLADLNSDGRADLVAPTTSGDRILLADTNGQLNEVAGGLPANTSATRFMAVHEVTGDQNVDVIGRLSNGDVLVYPGDGAGRFGAPTVLVSGFNGSQSRLLIADIDNDGQDDLIGGSEVHRRRPDGSFEPPWLYHSRTHQVADLNGDGRLDRMGIANRGQGLEVVLQRPTAPTAAR